MSLHTCRSGPRSPHHTPQVNTANTANTAPQECHLKMTQYEQQGFVCMRRCTLSLAWASSKFFGPAGLTFFPGGGGGEWRLTPCRPLPPHPRPHLNTSLHSPLARGREGGREGRREGSAKPACGSRARQPCVRPCVRSLRAVLGGRSTATRHPVCWLSPAALAPRS